MMTDSEVRKLRLGGMTMPSRRKNAYCDYCNRIIPLGATIYYMAETDVQLRKHVYVAHEFCIDTHIPGSRKEQVPPKDEYVPPKRGANTPFSKALKEMFLGLPIDVRAKTYKNLAKTWHPDVGGNLELMKTLTVVWEEVS